METQTYHNGYVVCESFMVSKLQRNLRHFGALVSYAYFYKVRNGKSNLIKLRFDSRVEHAALEVVIDDCKTFYNQHTLSEWIRYDHVLVSPHHFDERAIIFACGPHPLPLVKTMEDFHANAVMKLHVCLIFCVYFCK